MARRPRFSVVTIVRNEASRLPRLLASLSEFRGRGGEIVVLDTGSDDGTPDVARAGNCRVFVEPRRFRSRLSPSQARRINATFMKGGEGPLVRSGAALFSFGQARAHAAGLATNDLQIAVDGGDVIEAMDIDFFDAAARSGREGAMQFVTRTLTPSGWQLELREYVHDRRTMQWCFRTHESLRPKRGASKTSSLRLSRSQLSVSHHTELGKPRAFQIAGLALDALENPAAVRSAFYLCRSLTVLGFHRSALSLALGLDRAGVAPGVRSAVLCFAAWCAAQSGASADDIDALLFRAAKRDSTSRDPLMRLAKRTLAHGEMQAATSFATAALMIPSRVGMSEAEENHGAGPHAVLYWALVWLGRRDEARGHFERCRLLEPANPVYAAHANLFAP